MNNREPGEWLRPPPREWVGRHARDRFERVQAAARSACRVPASPHVALYLQPERTTVRRKTCGPECR